MTRMAIYLTVIVAMTLGGLRLLHHFAEEDRPQIDRTENERWARQVFVTYACFKPGFAATLEALGKGEISLREAHGRIHSLALRYNPAYLEHLKLSEQGATTDERLARNLVDHIRSIDGIAQRKNPHLPHLEAELVQLLHELE